MTTFGTWSRRFKSCHSDQHLAHSRLPSGTDIAAPKWCLSGFAQRAHINLRAAEAPTLRTRLASLSECGPVRASRDEHRRLLAKNRYYGGIADYDEPGAFSPSTALVPALERNISPNLLSPCGLGFAGRQLGDFSHVYRIDPLRIFDRLVGVRGCLLLPHRPSGFRHNCCPLSRPDLSDDKPDAQERPDAARPRRHYPQRAERPRGDERSNGHARPGAPPARRMRADGERHWAVAVGPDRWALRFLNGACRADGKS